MQLALEQLYFWHPVGPHAGESLAEIVARKGSDVQRFGFTPWSFAPARLERVVAWRAELEKRGQETAIAVGCGDSTSDPSVRSGSEPRWLTEYSEDLVTWKKLPSKKMTSYHRAPSKSGVVASAFLVTRVSAPPEMRVARPRHWFSAKHSVWYDGALPTRGEYLVGQPPPLSSGTRVRVLLELKHPFVVWLR